ncbi:2508_t:CDS:1, partial [Scutellospora calospora]
EQNVEKVIQHSNTLLQCEIVETTIYHDKECDWKRIVSSNEHPDLIDFTSLERHNPPNKFPLEINISLKDLIKFKK